MRPKSDAIGQERDTDGSSAVNRSKNLARLRVTQFCRNSRKARITWLTLLITMNGNTSHAIGRIKTIRPSAIAPIPRAAESEASANIIFAKSSFQTAKLSCRFGHGRGRFQVQVSSLAPPRYA